MRLNSGHTSSHVSLPQIDHFYGYLHQNEDWQVIVQVGDRRFTLIGRIRGKIGWIGGARILRDRVGINRMGRDVARALDLAVQGEADWRGEEE